MGVTELIAALPTEASGDLPERDLLRTELVQGVVGFIAADTSVVSDVLQVDPVDAALGGVRQAYVYGMVGVFVYDEDDEITAHDGVFCLVLIGGYRYKILGAPKIGYVLSKDVTTPPDPDDVDPEDRPAFGDAYLNLGGTWPHAVNSIEVWSSLEGGSWQEIEPAYGPPLYVVDTDSYVHWAGDDGWVAGVGSSSHPADTIPLSALIGLDASFVLKVENQTTYAPPGSRVTGATPTAPLGGTAANLNDDSDSTVTTTSALGDLTAAALADRIIARLSLAEATDLIALEARGFSCSAGSSGATGCGLYYSTNNGSSWTQAGAGFQATTTAADIRRAGAFADVTDIAIITEAKAWSTATNSIKGLNAFDATIVCNVGVSYIPAANSIGVFAGNEGKVLRCEVEDTFTVYTPAVHDEVADKATGIKIRWNGTAWISATGAVLGYDLIGPESVSLTVVTGGGITAYTYSNTTAPTTTNFQGKDAARSYTAKAANNKLIFRYRAHIGNISEGSLYVAALFRNLVANAVDWCLIDLRSEPGIANVTLVATAPDNASHDYFIAIVTPGAGVDTAVSASRRVMEILEVG